MSASDDFVVEYQVEDDMISIPLLVRVGRKKWIRLPGKYFSTDAKELCKILGFKTEVRAFYINPSCGTPIQINNLATMDGL